MEITTKHLVIFGGGVLAGYLLVDYLRKQKPTTNTTQLPIGQLPDGDSDTPTQLPPDGGRTNSGQPYVPCTFIDGEIVEANGWLNSGFSDYKFSISNQENCMGHTLESNLVLDIEKNMVQDMVQYKGKAILKSASMVENPTKRDENVPIIYT